MRAGDAAVEMNIVARIVGSRATARLVFGRDLDGGRRSIVDLDEIRFAVQRYDSITVGGARLGDVVAPLKGLHRVLRRRDR